VNEREKVAKWLFENGQGRMDGDDWDSIRNRPLWEKVVQRYMAKAEEILDLIGQQGEPVAGPVASITPRFQLPPIWQLLPGGYELEINLPHPLYLHPPASLEGKADYKDLRDFVEECAKPPYGDSSAESLLAWVEGRAQTLLRTTAPPASRGGACKTSGTTNCPTS